MAFVWANLFYPLPYRILVTRKNITSWKSWNSGWITTGPKSRQFEREFAARVGASHAVAVNSCTAAMHLALEALALRPGDLVLTTPYTFAATAEVIRYFDAIPVFVDVEPETLNLDTHLLAEVVAGLQSMSPAAADFLPPAHRSAWSNRGFGVLKALMPVHMAGWPCELEAIYDMAAQQGLAVIEDAAHAFGATYQQLPIGCLLSPGSFGRMFLLLRHENFDDRRGRHDLHRRRGAGGMLPVSWPCTASARTRGNATRPKATGSTKS